MTFRGDYAQGQGGNVNTSSGGGRGGGGLGNGAMMLLPLLLRGGGGGTIILVLLALLYFSGAFNGILGGGGNDSQSQSQDEYSLEHCQEAGSSNEYDDCRAAATMSAVRGGSRRRRDARSAWQPGRSRPWSTWRPVSVCTSPSSRGSSTVRARLPSPVWARRFSGPTPSRDAGA